MGKNKKSKKDKYSAVEKAAHMQGMVARGLRNKESLISESFQKGLKVPEKRQKKSLF